MTKVRILFEEMNRDTVPPDMAGDILFDSRSLGVLLHDVPREMLIDGFAPVRNKVSNDNYSCVTQI